MNATVPILNGESATAPEPPPFADLPEQEARRLLVDFALLGVAAFAEVFDRIAGPRLGAGRSFEVLRQFVKTDREACEMAVGSAASNGFMSLLADALAITPGGEGKIRAQLLGSPGTRHIAEGVLDTVNGLSNTTVLGELCQVTNSLCLVRERAEAMGTGILIDHDLVLTAAHVLDACGYLADGSTNASIRDWLTLEFNSPHLSGGPYVARLADDWLVAYSHSCINQPGHVLSAQSASVLDFALLRLNAAVPGYVRRLSIERGGRLPPLPLTDRERQRRYYVLGYPGGADSKFGMGPLHDVDPAAARILHLCGSLGGMSGAPLLDDNARLIGFHEGKVTDLAGNTLFNRATMVAKVAAAIAGSRTAEPPRAQYVEHQAVRQRWARYARDAGAAVIPAWSVGMRVAGADAQGAGLDDPSDHFYPVFTARPLEAWLSASSDAHASSRVLVLGGAPGTGKSFALEYARARLGHDQVLAIGPEISSQLPLHDMLAQLCPGGELDDPWRPFDGRMRNTYLLGVLDYFDGLAAATASGILLIAVDCDPKAAFWEEAQHFWHQFALLCHQRPSLRLLLCGPSDALRDELSNASISYGECQALDGGEISRYCEGLAHRLQRHEAAEWAAKQGASLWADPGRPSARIASLGMCDGARIALTVRQSLLNLERSV